jgi:hypothetical protein
MKLGALDAAGYMRLFRALLGTGYTQDEDGPHGAELLGMAEIAAMVSEAPDNAVRNMFVSHAVEALDEHDQMRGMPTDANLTTAQRQARLVAFTRALPKLIRARLDQALDRWLGTSTGETIAPTTLIAQNHGCSHWGGLVVSRMEPSAGLQQLRVIDDILKRGLPARALSKRAGTRDAEYGQPVDRSILTSLDPSPAVPVLAPNVAPHEKFPGEVVTLDDWREIQAQLLWKPYNGGPGSTTNQFTVAHTNAGNTMYAEGSIGAGATFALTFPGWNERVVQAWCAAGAASFTDSTAAGISHGYISAAKLGSLAVPFVHAFVGTGVVTGLTLSLPGPDTRAVLTNTSGATIHYRIILRKSPFIFQDTLNDREPWTSLTDFNSVSVSSAWEAGRIDVKDSLDNYVSDGVAVRRILYTGAMQRDPGGDAPVLVTLDTSVDWRLRAILVVALGAGSNTTLLNAASHRMANGVSNDSDPIAKVFLSYTGATANSAAVGARQYADPTGNIWIWADSTTGHLMAEMKESVSTNEYAHAFFMVSATSGAGTPYTLPIDSPDVYPGDLNIPQIVGCFAQGQGTVDDPVTLPPLGVINDGAVPLRPVSWLVRERLSSVADRSIELRQKIFGQRRRVLSMGILAGATIDADAFTSTPGAGDSNLDQMDYRDRLVFIECSWSSTDISLGRATQLSDAAADKFAWCFYGGPYDDHAVTFADITLTFDFQRSASAPFQSRLRVTNGSAGTLYVNLMVEATGFLGLTDRRLVGA